MLVLERKMQEGFWIDDRIFVKVLSIGRRRVRLGVAAPIDARVVREELRGSASKNGVASDSPKEARKS